MHSSKLSRRAAAGVGLASLLLLSACSGTSTTPTSASTSSSVPPATVSSSTATPSPTPTATSTAPPVSLPTYTAGQKLTADQVTALLTPAFTGLSTVHMDMTVKSASSGAGDITMSADADYTTTPISLAGTMTMASMPIGAPMKVVLVDGTFYMNLGSMSQNLYIKVSLAQLDSGSGTNLMDSFDPAKSLTQFSTAVSSGTFVGQETLNGAEVAHYTVMANTKQLVKANSALLASAPKKVIKRFTSKKERQVESVWVDGQGHIVKAVTQSFSGTTTVEFSKFGDPVTITAPPSDQVTEVPGIS